MQLITIIIIIIVIISKFNPIAFHEGTLSLTSTALPPGKITGTHCNNDDDHDDDDDDNNNNNNSGSYSSISSGNSRSNKVFQFHLL
jgi:hypothetical protein